MNVFFFIFSQKYYSKLRSSIYHLHVPFIKCMKHIFSKRVQKIGTMINLGQTLISDDVIDEAFVCDLHRCRGACCIEGELGAPLETTELRAIHAVIECVKPYLSEEAIRVLEEKGGYVVDEDDEFSTPTINGRECAFAFYDDNGILKCSIEQAHQDGKTHFKKPISCHLYPVRVVKLPDFEALNYDRWHICSPACELGKKRKTPVYKFLKDALIRKYGKPWYSELESIIKTHYRNKSQ